MRLIYSVLWLLILLLGIAFGLLNPQQVKVDYFTSTAHVFLPLLVVIAIAIGVVLCWLAMSPGIMRYRRHNRKLRKQLQKAERELQQKKSSSSYQESLPN